MAKVRPLMLAGVFCFALAAAGQAAAPDEFYGPLAGWRDVKSYGAVGNGAADDTAAIQKALDDLRSHRDFNVLYFPAGRYRITAELKTVREAHTDYMGVWIAGEDPARTSIVWDGPDGGTMLQLSAWHSKISRISLDGSKKAAVCLAYGPKFSTYNETSDMAFQNAGTGLLLGVGDAGQAENAVLRCHFIACGRGLVTASFNSMDIWVWYCLFENCEYGLYNGAGNFHVYRSLFLRSSKADVKSENLMVFSFVENTSIGSTCFIDFKDGHSWGSPTSITGNRITGNADAPVRLGNGGPYLVVDNVIQGRKGLLSTPIDLTWGDQVLVGNTYSTALGEPRNGRVLRIDDGAPTAPEVVDFPVMPAAPLVSKRRVFEMRAGDGAAAIQNAIDRAAAEGAVVHLPRGRYRIEKTIEVPAGAAIGIIGDGAAETATLLEWVGEPLGTVFRLKGPSKAFLRDFMIASPAANGILIDNADQAGGKVHINQLYVTGVGADSKPLAGVLVRGLELSDVQLDNLQGGQASKAWVRVTGGPRLRDGQDAPGSVRVFCGATGTADKFYSVAKGGRLVARSVYHEMSRSSEETQALLLDDAGFVALDAMRFSSKTSERTPLIAADGFRGDFMMATSLLMPVNSEKTARLGVSGDGRTTRFLSLANLFWVKDSLDMRSADLFRDRSSPPAQAGFVLCNANLNDKKSRQKFAALENAGKTDEDFVRKMLEPLRKSRTWIPAETGPGLTDVRIHRVVCRTGKNTVGVELRAAERV